MVTLIVSIILQFISLGMILVVLVTLVVSTINHFSSMIDSSSLLKLGDVRSADGRINSDSSAITAD